MPMSVLWITLLAWITFQRGPAATRMDRCCTAAARPDYAPAPSPRAADSVVNSLLARMTLEEKLGQLNLITADSNRVTPAEADSVRRGLIGGFFNLTGAQRTRDIQQVAVSRSRLRIPLLFGEDVIHGYRTTFPVNLAEAATWDPDLVERTAHAAAAEAAAAGVTWTFAPMVDIARDPRWGRIVEGAGEDPYLGSVMAAAWVRGFQGRALSDPDAVMATAKHFAAYGAAEGGRDYNTADVSERTLREIYLPPFHAAVRAGVGAIMAGFDDLDGVPATANRWLLTDVLRREWGFHGLVVSDYTAINELQEHGVAGSPADAGRLALEAGVDMDMMSGIYVGDLRPLVERGEIPLAAVDEAVRRVLRAKVALGLFRDPYHGATPEGERAAILTADDRALARRDGDEAMVLLRNEGAVLPLSPAVRTLAVIGPLAHDSADALGPWAALGRADDVVTALAGIRARVSPQTTVLYARGCGITGADTSGLAEAVDDARRADATILVLGEAAWMSGEAASRSSLDLPGVQQRLLEAVVATGKPVVLVVMSGRPLAIAWAADHVPAVLQAWFLGDETGPALADVLFGDVAPSGKLPVSVPRTVGQVPIYYDHMNTGRPGSPTEHYTSKYLDLPLGPLYPFGWGLSYTTFAYSDLRLSKTSIAAGDRLTVSATVTNTGSRPGAEVAQLYIRDPVASVTRPVRQLEGFQRVSLRPGESTTVTFPLTPERLGFYDQAMRFVVEPGTIEVFVGGSSEATLRGSFTIRGPARPATAP